MLSEDMHDAMATQHEAAREFISNIADPEGPAWLLSPYDSWHPNPAYSGPPVPHPEDEEYAPRDPSEWIDEPYTPVPPLSEIVIDPNTPF